MTFYAETSRHAYRAHNPGPVNLEILDAIFNAGPEGLTADEVEALTGIDHQTVSANISHMKNGTMGSPVLLRATGKKGPTRKGRLAAKLCLNTEIGEVAPKPRKVPFDSASAQRICEILSLSPVEALTALNSHWPEYEWAKTPAGGFQAQRRE